MYFLDLFAGIGGFRLGMEQAGHKCAGYVEIDKFARKSYEAIHDTEGEWTAHDITTVTDESIRGLEGVDVICGGFPCQAFSVAGKRGGFNDIRGTLFFEIARFANILRPRYLFLENVTGLLSHDNGNTFETILGALDEIGFDAEWSCINSKRFVPQNRERVFIIGHSRTERTRKVFPISADGRQINELQGQQIYTNTLKARYEATGDGSYIIESEQYAQDRHGVMIIDDLQSEKFGGIKTYKDNAPTLRSERFGLKVADGYRIRKLTPRECFRLQGFPDWAFNRAARVNSDSQLYKQAGNSVTVNVIYKIAKRLW